MYLAVSFLTYWNFPSSWVSLSCRDQSASATYYFHEKPESERANDNVPKPSASAEDNLVKEWMYYRSLQHGESEFPLRNKQVTSVYMLYFQRPVRHVLYHNEAALLSQQWIKVKVKLLFLFYTVWVWNLKQLDCTTFELYTHLATHSMTLMFKPNHILVSSLSFLKFYLTNLIL